MEKRCAVRVAAIAIAALAVMAWSLPAAAGDYYHKGTFEAGGGFNIPVGETNDYFNENGTLLIGGGRNLNQATTVQVEWTHNWMSIAPEVIERAQSDSVQFDDTHASMWSITLNFTRRFGPEKEIVPWLTGGLGFYKRNLQMTQNMYVYYPPVWDPWWGWIDGGWYPGEVITGSRETGGFGYNIGFGFDTRIESGASLFVDVRWHQAFLDGLDMTLIPVMAGVRW
jgi:hypothetical protein